jgi:hypothetical protein
MKLTVAHYLGIYKIRKAMMDDGTTTPSPDARKLIEELVTRLGEVDPGLQCGVVRSNDANKPGAYIFVVNAEEIARIDTAPELA